MRRNEGGFSSKLLHRHRCPPLNNYRSLFLSSRVNFVTQNLARVNTQEIPSLAGSSYNILVSASRRHLGQNL